MATTVGHSEIPQFLPDYSAEFLGELQGILDKARRFSGATGAAIAFVEGEELVTKAGLGGLAPEAGSRTPIMGSFTGLSIRSREVQRCDDATADPRVDKGACAALGIVSMVIVPIIEEKKPIGVIAAFSPKANAFNSTHVALLRTLADIVVELRNRYPAAVAATTASPELELPVPEVPAVAQPLVERAPVVVSKPFLVPKELPKIEAPKPAPEPAISVDPQSSARAVAMAKIEARAAEKPAVEPVKSVVVPPVPPVTKTDKVSAKTAAVNRSEPPKPDPKPERKSSISDSKEQILTAADDIGPSVVTQKTAEPPLFSSYSNASAALEREHGEERGTRMLILAVVVVVIAAVAGGAWWYKQRSAAPQAPAPVEQQVAQDAAPSNPAPEVSTPASNQPAVVLSPKSEPVVPVQTFALNSKESAKSSEPEPKPKVSTPAMVLKEPTAIPRMPKAEDVQAPSVAPAGTAGLGNILGGIKTAAPKAAFHSSEMTPPQLVSSTSPVFPEFARKMHIRKEQVILSGTVNTDGSLSNLKAVKGSSLFTPSAIKAVRQWKYKPAYLNGEVVSANIEIVINFADNR